MDRELGGDAVLIRLAILVAVLYILYRVFFRKRPDQRSQEPARNVPREDVLVQDPWCKTFLPKGQALEVQSQEQVLHFCSPECRDRFLAQGQGQKGE